MDNDNFKNSLSGLPDSHKWERDKSLKFDYFHETFTIIGKEAFMEEEKLSHKIIGLSMKVHSDLGCGFPEVYYQRALAIAFKKQNIHFIREKEIEVFFERESIGKRRVDFFIETKIMLEIKARPRTVPAHYTQIMNYCRSYNLPFGLLINFGTQSLEYKRVYNLDHKKNKNYRKNSP